MTLLKFIIPIILLTHSCPNNKANQAEQDVQNDVAVTNKKEAHNIIQEQEDSIYLKNLQYLEANPYADYYVTKLKGGYSITYYHDKKYQYLLYKKGDSVIDTIGACSLGLLYKNLGYVGADFDKTFVFVNSFGSGNPHYISLYDKESMKNLIPSGSAWIAVDTIAQVLLYSKNDVPSEKNGDKMTLYDTRKMSEKDYEFPQVLMGELDILGQIRLVAVTEETFDIEYYNYNVGGIITKQYGR